MLGIAALNHYSNSFQSYVGKPLMLKLLLIPDKVFSQSQLLSKQICLIVNIWKISFCVFSASYFINHSTWSQPWPWRELCHWVSESAQCNSACCCPQSLAFARALVYCHPGCRRFSLQGCLKYRKTKGVLQTILQTHHYLLYTVQ